MLQARALERGEVQPGHDEPHQRARGAIQDAVQAVEGAVAGQGEGEEPGNHPEHEGEDAEHRAVHHGRGHAPPEGGVAGAEGDWPFGFVEKNPKWEKEPPNGPPSSPGHSSRLL